MNKVVTVSIFVCAVGYSLLTGPFRGADEPNHFFRAFHVSEGGVLAMHGPEGIVGQFLPANLLSLVQVAGNDSLKKMSSIPMVAIVICLAANLVALGLLARATFF
jgi:hypothetical protein